MALKNYAIENEEEYYGQNFEKDGVVSVWLGFTVDVDEPENLDVLQDLCGVGYYDIDNQESNTFNFESVPISELLEDLSYAESFSKEVESSANILNLFKAKWVLVQYDFEYEPSKVTRECALDPVFIGVFSYSENNEL